MRLKKCPFCGSEPILRGVSFDDYYVVKCEKCGAQMGPKNGSENAAKAWNKRPDRKQCSVTLWRTDIEKEYDEQGMTFSCCGYETALSRSYPLPEFCPGCGARVIGYEEAQNDED